MINKKIYWFIYYINKCNIVFYLNKEYHKNYIRIYSNNILPLIYIQKIFSNYFINSKLEIYLFKSLNLKKWYKHKGIIEKHNNIYKYTIQKPIDILYFIILIKNNINNYKLNRDLNIFVKKLYFYPELNNIKDIMYNNINILFNKIYYDKSLKKLELSMKKREYKREKRIYKTSIFHKRYKTITYLKTTIKKNSLNYSLPLMSSLSLKEIYSN